MLVSIIIPVYNAQKTLERCLNSIRLQTLQSFEVLMINDGSNDNSAIICEHYAALYEQFKVIHIPNGGVSNARNVGIEVSRGKYLSFVDADDEIIEDYLSILLNNEDIDFALCGYKAILPDNKIEYEAISQSDTLVGQSLKNILINHRLVRIVWGKLFRRSVIFEHNLKFDSSIKLGEDTIFVLNYLVHAKNIDVSPSYGYIYYKASFDINRYHISPEELIKVLYEFKNIEIIYSDLGYETTRLSIVNWDTVSFYFFNLIYAPNVYSRDERLNYHNQLFSLSYNYSLNFLSPLLNKLLIQPLIKRGNSEFVDTFLILYFYILRLKKNRYVWKN